MTINFYSHNKKPTPEPSLRLQKYINTYILSINNIARRLTVPSDVNNIFNVL